MVRLRAFPDYFAERGNVQNLNYVVTPDASVRLQKLRANECQGMAYPEYASLEAIERDQNLKLLKEDGFNMAYVALNVKKKPFDNKLVRQAIHHALNKKILY